MTYMNLFKKLSRTAADTYVSLACKKGAVKKIGKINAMLDEERRNIEALYIEIGKAYFDAHSTDIDCEFADKILAINEAKQKIEDGERQKQALRKVQRCENCGAEMSDTLSFCTVCGNKFPVAEEHVVCTHCAASVPKGMSFCTECGKLISGVVQEEKAAPQNCPSCGAKLKKKNLFCTECGTEIK